MKLSMNAVAIGILETLIAAACTGIDARPPYTGLPAQTPTGTQYGLSACTKSLQQVRSGIVEPRAYIREMELCLPEAAHAKSSGTLKGVIYEPSDQELETLLKQLFFEAGANEQEVPVLTQASLNGYKTIREATQPHGMLIPNLAGFFGMEIPSYVVFTERMLQLPQIKSDSDVRIQFIHELQHIEDWYNGVTMGDIYLDAETAMGKLGDDFLQGIFELRAHYRALESILTEFHEKGSTSISPQLFYAESRNYHQYWDFLQNYRATGLEIEVRARQLRQSSGIVPERNNAGLVLIHSTLFGEKITLTASDRPPSGKP